MSSCYDTDYVLSWCHHDNFFKVDNIALRKVVQYYALSLENTTRLYKYYKGLWTFGHFNGFWNSFKLLVLCSNTYSRDPVFFFLLFAMGISSFSLYFTCTHMVPSLDLLSVSPGLGLVLDSIVVILTTAVNIAQ